jgi:maltose alpha-D-glucosyltransferase/alpha-amylase
MNDSPRERHAIFKTEKDPFWYKKAIIYELHVRSFFDSNADGIGDFPGLTQKLDYLQDLGITAIWLLPFYPSPLRDDGYDIADYYSINPMYGTLDQFKTFLNGAHDRGLRVITELVINHTSDQHPWFQRARRSLPNSNFRDYYVWSNDPQKYQETRIIFKDFEPSNWTWDPVANAYYWHRFFFHQPDLNFDNPEVHREIMQILDFWLDIGVDGMRLDAIPYLYEREGTSCESLPETHAFLKKLRSHVDEKYGDRMFLAEANQWPEDSAAYFGEGRGDECHVAFHFPLMPRLFMSVRMEDRFPIIDILEQTPPIPETSAWAIFLRNHDELTLEMVTDEERDYMYRMYAGDVRARINLGIRRRLAPLLGNDRRKIELLHLLLLSLPGTPVLYYGDEIGMGDNTFLGDRNGVRTPMHWSSDKNAGFSKASPHALVFPVIVDPEYHYETVNVETQQRNPNSLLWWIRRMLALRQRLDALSEGDMQFLHPGNRKVMAYIRKAGEQVVLVVANLSRYAQPVSLDLAAFKDWTPVELFGRAPFPTISEAPYTLSLSPYAAFWFLLEPATVANVTDLSALKPLRIRRNWTELFDPHRSGELEKRLPQFLKQQSWFIGRVRTISSVKINRLIPFTEGIAFVTLYVDFNETDAEEYLLPVAIESHEPFPDASQVQLLLARAEFEDGSQCRIFDATGSPGFWNAVQQIIAGKESRSTTHGTFAPWSELPANISANPAEVILNPNQNNSSAMTGDLFLKLIRRIEAGVNPEIELDRFLTEKAFANIAPLLGGLNYQNSEQEFSFCIVTQRVPNARTAWEFTFDALTRYFDRTLSSPPIPNRFERIISAAKIEFDEAETQLFGAFAESARLLGRRTAELHLVLASDSSQRDFEPEEFVPFSQRSLYQSMRNFVLRTIQTLDARSRQLTEENALLAREIITRHSEFITFLKQLYQIPMRSVRIRVHGNLHLAQVLHTGRDFVFIDFEGESDRSYGERRLKRTPLKDIAGMVRSFHQVSEQALYGMVDVGKIVPEKTSVYEGWSKLWRNCMSSIFIESYREALAGSRLVPPEPSAFEALFYACLIETAFTDLSRDMLYAPDRAQFSLRAILEVLGQIKSNE